MEGNRQPTVVGFEKAVRCASPKDSRTAPLLVPFDQIRSAGFTAHFFSTTLTTCRCTALAATPTHFQSNDSNVESFLTGYFRLQALEQRTGEFFNPPTLKTRQMNVIHVGLRFVEMLLPVQVHQVKFINQPQLFQEFESSVHGRSVYPPVMLPCQRQQRGCVKMAVSFLNRFQQYFSLPGDADAPQRQFLKQ